MVENGTVFETKFLKTIYELKKTEVLKKKLVVEVKAAGGDKNNAENTELQN